MIRRRLTTVLGVAAAVTVALPWAAAGAAPWGLGNGDLEADPVGATEITGWTVTSGLVDLGVTTLGGCVSRDTSSYAGLRDWDGSAQPVFPRDLPVGPDEELLHPETRQPVWIDEAGQPTTADAPGARQVFHGFAGEGPSYRNFYLREDGAVDWRSSWGEAGRTFWEAVEPWYAGIPDPVLRADDVPPVDQGWFYRADPELLGSVVDGTEDPDAWYAIDPLPRSRALALSTWAMTWEPGVVVHGPAAVSDPFTVGSGRSVALDWAAPSSTGGFGESSVQDHHVLAYALDVDSCHQYELLDSTGSTTGWRSAAAALPPGGTYRVVVVAGAYDHDWSGSASSLLLVDDVRVVPTITGSGVVVEPLFGQGDRVAGAPVRMAGGGLKPNSPWIAELHSTPVTLATGVTDSSGNFWLLSNLPASVEPGKHRIILSGTAPDGSPVSSTAWITVTAAGTVGYVSLAGEEIAAAPAGPTGTIPQDAAAARGARPALARTGAEPVALLGLATGLVATGGLALVAARRRTATR
ncbi:hypothetical protein JKP75_17535 [Blastococcus sp. TML/M2B]|uniref:hypothetical protein n=1 Tax=unclassified Blastococcus TaxID=2619396 RepID=UPI00190C20DD|nr:MULTISPECIES: hypothetical protein [unclassified Blastococcus]MBN1094197.1 hypothetical protein [Blastococcus sp. TML/M2B]MBN1095689.1 hypothetical protein [Blastococcus sp. TML/C7B]